MKETEVEPHYKKQASDIVDVMFDNGYFAKEVKREDLRKLEEYFAFIVQSSVKSALIAHDSLRRIREREQKA